MSEQDAAKEMKTRLRADLVTAMKEKRTMEVKVLRALIATLDNAEAVSQGSHNGATEVERLLLGHSQVHELLLADITERESAATELEQAGNTERAEALRTEAVLVRRYLTSESAPST